VTRCNSLQRIATHCNTPGEPRQDEEESRQDEDDFITLQHTATHCNTLQHAATRQESQDKTKKNLDKFQAARLKALKAKSHKMMKEVRSVLQCVAVCCSVLQCGVVHYSVLQCVAVCCSVLQSVAVCCSVLQCGVIWCSVI